MTIRQPIEQNNGSIRFSLRVKLLLLLLGVTLIIALGLGYFSFTAIQQAGATAQDISSDALLNQSEELLVQLTVGNARENALILDKTLTDAKNVSEYANFIFNQPTTVQIESTWSPQEFMFLGPDGQYINGEEDIATVFIPNTVELDDELLQTLETATVLDNIFIPIYEQDSNTVAIWTAMEQEITRYYPNIGLGEIVPPDFTVTEEPFYIIAIPENNPEGDTIWSTVYDDPAGQGLLVSAIAPIHRDGQFLGVIGIDFTLNNLAANIEAETLVENSYSFLIDDDSRAIALPAQGYLDILGRPAETGEFGADLSETVDEFTPVIADMQIGETGFTSVTVGDNRELFIAYAPLETPGWSLGTVVEAEAILQQIAPIQSQLAEETNSLILSRVLPLSGLVVIVVLGLGLWLVSQFVTPLQQLTVAAQSIGAGRWDTPLPRPNSDEVGLLTWAINSMVGQLQGLFDTLEERITDRTQQLEAMTDINEHLASILDLDTLLVEIVKQVGGKFNFYHTQIYLVDNTSES
ncbi:MAG: HAMP domain-containing protein, partial [Chloroflexota bacterium]